MKLTIYRPVVVYAAVVLALTIPFCAAHANSDEFIAVSYEVRVSGLTAFTIEYSSNISADGYQSKVSVKTGDIVSLFSGYRLKMESSGSFSKGEPRPAQFSSQSEKHAKTKFVKLNWSSDGTPMTGGPSKENPSIQAEIDAALKAGVVDPLTAVLRLGAPSATTLCANTLRIFDGRDVFDLRFAPKKEVTIGSDVKGIYRGTAFECDMTYMPVAGRSATKFMKRKTEPPTYKVWFAPVQIVVPERSLFIPVFASGMLDDMKFIAYTNRATIGGNPFNQLSVAKK